MLYELTPLYINQKSFYGKAQVLEQNMSDWKEKVLYSYDTVVAKIIETNKIRKYIYYGYFSTTTAKHQNEFFRRNGLTEKEIKKLKKNGVLEEKVNG